jgi:hypothetical protein
MVGFAIAFVTVFGSIGKSLINECEVIFVWENHKAKLMLGHVLEWEAGQ